MERWALEDHVEGHVSCRIPTVCTPVHILHIVRAHLMLSQQIPLGVLSPAAPWLRLQHYAFAVSIPSLAVRVRT